MREILYRGKVIPWDNKFYDFEKSYGDWIEDDLTYLFTDRPDRSNRLFPHTVSQFTGRIDCVRNKIFENDIVEEAGGHRSVVKYSEEEAKFVLESKYAITELGNKQVTVIGNIFDNPDLIDNA